MIVEYAAEIISGRSKDKVTLQLEVDGLSVLAPFDSYYLPYSEIKSFGWQDYSVRILAEDKSFTISHLNDQGGEFFHELYKAYNSKVRQALYIKGDPSFQAEANFRYVENEIVSQGSAVIEVYENCVLILPPDERARRIPLYFASKLERIDCGVTIELNTGERYCFGRLGLDTEALARHIERSLHGLREKALTAIREIDGGLNMQQLADIAKIVPEESAVPLICLYSIAPSFVQSLEAKIAKRKINAKYQFLKQNFNIEQICIGIKRGLYGEKGENTIWLITPGKNFNTAAVEIATCVEEATATFLYGSISSWEVFWQKLNQVMEAVGFNHKLILLSKEELLKPEYTQYAMLIKRNPALQLIRRHFGGSHIHYSLESWKQEILSYMA
ncbi:MAG TPA: hypothetical protein GXZ59_01730 [Clostridiaceae bacterium]|nr:hypothetical protein [Clostridiaceae bacterium]